MPRRLDLFKVPRGFRGRSALVVQLWWFVSSIFFAHSPQFMYGWRRFILRAFGAKIGRGVIIRPSVTITYPWKLKVGDFSWVGDDVCLYTLAEIYIGNHSVVSQKSYICTGGHYYNSEGFEIYARPVHIGDNVWVATDVFVSPGVKINNEVIVGARSSVFQDLPENMICYGSPAIPVKPR